MISALILILGLLCQWRIGFNNDNAWLLYIARRSLEGQVLYRDLIEINPPALIWFDQAVVGAARVLHLDPVSLFRIAVAGLAVASAGWSSRLARSSIPESLRRSAFAGLLFVLILLPVSWFGQREHFVLLLLLPLLATSAAREHGAVGQGSAMVSGVLAGLGLCIKPQYLIVWLLLLGSQVKARRGWSALRAPEHLAVTVTGAVYLALVLTFTPEYLPMVRRLGGLYAEYRTATLPRLVAGDFAALVILLALAILIAYRRLLAPSPARSILLLATVGLYVGAMLQGKGFDYHYYPALATALLLLVMGAATVHSALPSGRRARIAMLALSSIATVPYVLAALRIGVVGDDPGMRAYRELERAVGPVRGEPVLVLSARSGYAFGLVTYAGADWVGGFPCLWVPGVLQAERSRGREHLGFEVEQWFRDVVIGGAETSQPQVILISRPAPPEGPPDLRVDLLDYFSTDPRFRNLMTAYRPDGESVGYRIFRRRITAVESRYQVVQP